MTEHNVFSIISGKGGTGKSIITVSLGYALSNLGFKTLLIDTDFYTNGLTYYVLSDYPRRIKRGLRNIFVDENTLEDLQLIEIPNPYCKNNLFLLPSSTTMKNDYFSELSNTKSFSDLSEYVQKMERILYHIKYIRKFDYILIDSRGGSDITSIGAAMCSKAPIIITEADKPSWDMGNVLINTLDEANSILSCDVTSLGFIINKNVLPSESVETFLRKEWRCPHIITIDLDKEVITHFQQDKIPIVENELSQFSYSIFRIIRKLFVNEMWSFGSKDELSDKIEKSFDNVKKIRLKEMSSNSIEKLSTLFKIYSFILLMIIFIYFAIFSKNIFVFISEFKIESAIIISLLLSLIYIPDLLKILIRKLFYFKIESSYSNIDQKIFR